MKVLLIGGLGSIGKRYAAILRNLKVNFDTYDITVRFEPKFENYDSFIVATPTDTHLDYLKKLKSFGRPILCEKPISKNVDDIPTDLDAYVVCNYLYVVRMLNLPSPFKIFYDYYNTGKDGMHWDCCQLIYLDPQAKLRTNSHRWNLNVNDNWIKYRNLEEAYYRMISDFVFDKRGQLWTMTDAKRMSQAVVDRIRRDSEYENRYEGR